MARIKRNGLKNVYSRKAFQAAGLGQLLGFLAISELGFLSLPVILLDCPSSFRRLRQFLFEQGLSEYVGMIKCLNQKDCYIAYNRGLMEIKEDTARRGNYFLLTQGDKMPVSLEVLHQRLRASIAQSTSPF